MHRGVRILFAVSLGLAAVSPAGAHAAGFRGLIERGFVAQDRQMCRWGAAPDGGPACRIVRIRDEDHSRGSLADRLNGWQGRQEIRFDAVYYNGQQWAEVYDAIAVFVKTRAGWKLRYSSMGNGENGLAPGAATARP